MDGGDLVCFFSHRVDCLKPITMGYQLATAHVRKGGCQDIGDTEIKDMIMAVAMEEAVPAWREKVPICVCVLYCLLCISRFIFLI